MPARLVFIPLLVLMSVMGPSIQVPANSPTGTTIQVNTTLDDIDVNGNCTLREAILAANTDAAVDACLAGSGADTIVLPAGDYVLSLGPGCEDAGLGGDLDIYSDLSIQGTGPETTTLRWLHDEAAEIWPLDRLFQVLSSGQDVHIEDITFGESATPYCPDNESDWASVLNQGRLNLATIWFTSSSYTTAIENSGHLSITDSRFFNLRNVSIGNAEGAVFEMTNTVIENNLSEGSILSNAGQFTIRDSTFRNNRTDFDGNAITNTATGIMNITNTSISGSGTSYSTGVVFNNGGQLTVTHSHIFQNASAWGGGIQSSGGSVLIESSVIEENWARFGGAGTGLVSTNTQIINTTIASNYSGHHESGISNWGGSLEIIGSTIMNNSSSDYGSAIHSTSYIILRNTTISGNTAEEEGAGLSLASGRLEHVTIIGNTAKEVGGGLIASGPVEISNSIIAGNGTQPQGQSPIPEDCSAAPGLITSQGGNLIGTTSGCNWTPGSGDQWGTGAAPLDPKLRPLADNGGPTLTHALLPGSPALDKARSSNCLPTDQRGIPRPLGAGCDVGAYEVARLKVDVRPRNTTNTIDLRQTGTVPVAVIGAKGYAQFNIDPYTWQGQGSIHFGRTGDEDSVALLGSGLPNCTVKDVNNDGLPDLVCQFQIQKLGFQCGNTTGILRVRLDGMVYEGWDRVRIVPCP